METNELNNFAKSETISIIKDPFDLKNIESISIFFRRYLSDGQFSSSAWVEFKNGSTEGKQTFEGKSLDEVILKVKHFIEQLSKQPQL